MAPRRQRTPSPNTEVLPAPAARSPRKRAGRKQMAPSPPSSSNEEIELNVQDSGSSSEANDQRPQARPRGRAATRADVERAVNHPAGLPGRTPGVSPAQASIAASASSQNKTPDIDHFFIRGNKQAGTKTVCWTCRDAYNANPMSNPQKRKPTFEYSITTGTTNLRSHLEKNHREKYDEACEEHGWPNMLPKHKQDSKAAEAQAAANANAKRMKFSIEAMHAKLVNFVVADDQSLNVVECPEFRALLLFLREELKDTDIPRRTHLRSLIIKAWAKWFERLKFDLQQALGNICFTADIWSDQRLRPHFAITAHWIARNERTKGLEFKSALIAFHRIFGRHDGKNLAAIALKILDRAGITVKVGHWTLDNAANNQTFMHELERLLKERDINFDAVDQRIMCFPHIINISSQHVIEEFTNLDLADFAHEFLSAVPADDPERQNYEDLCSGDPIALGRDIVRVLRASGQRRDDFNEIIRLGNERDWFGKDANGNPIRLRHLQLLRDVKTRWDSVFYMIRRLRELRPAIDYFLSTPTNKDIADYKLDDAQWKSLQDFEIILLIPHRVQQVMSRERNPVLAGALPAFEIFMTTWELLGQKNPHLKHWTDVGLEWANKYYSRMDLTKAYIVTMFLNPTIRMSWMRAHWTPTYVQKATKIIKTLMKAYRDKRPSRDASKSQSAAQSPHAAAQPEFGFDTLAQQYGLDDMDIGPSESGSDQSVDDEFRAYANGVLSPKGTDSLKFWEINTDTHRTLFDISMDYLPIQASAVPCERVFSSSAETDTKRRNRIKPELMEALQMLKFALKKERLDFMSGWETPESLMCDYDYNGGDLLSELLKPDSGSLLETLCADDLETELGDQCTVEP